MSVRRGSALAGIWAASCLSLAAPSAMAATAIYLQSPSGDWVGQGQTYTFSPPTSLTITHPDARRLTARFNDGWWLDFAAPVGQALIEGNYEGAQRYPFNSDTNPGLSLTSPGRGCNRVSGWFRVLEASYVNASVLSFAADFVQSCDGGPPLFGAIRYNSEVPLQRTQPYARIVPPTPAVEFETVTLDGSPSFDRASAVSWSWTQVGGPAVSLAGRTTSRPSFVAPAIPAGSDTLTFRLVVTDAQGLQDTVDVDVTVYDESATRTRALLDSPPGDYIGQGRRYEYVEPRQTVRVTSYQAPRLTVGLTGDEEWDVEFATPGNAAWAPGMYAGAERAAFRSPSRPGIDLHGEGRGCNKILGWFEVLEFEVTASSVSKLAIDFVQNCDGMPPLFGALRVNSDLPLDREAIYAIAGPDLKVLEGLTIALDGRQTYTRRGSPLTYRWRQLSGPTAFILNPASALTEVWLRDNIPATGATLEFELEATDAEGVADTDTAVVVVSSRLQPATYIRVDGAPGDYVSAGQDWFFAEGTDPINVSRNYDNGISIYVTSQGYWHFDFAAPNEGTLQPGAYENAMRFPFQDAGRPGLSYSGGGRGCNTLTGRFDVRSLTYNGTAVQSAAIDFSQSCEGTGPSTFGEVRINAVPDGYPVANAGPDRAANDNTEVTLSGAASTDPRGSVRAYRWRQAGGPPVTLRNPNTVAPAFKTPVLALGTSAQVTLVLEVTGTTGLHDTDEMVLAVTGTSVDSDGDGVLDPNDPFPQDPAESADSDADGVGNNADAFPNDPTETADGDGDGVGDNRDAFPANPDETDDADGDGTGDNGDRFPMNPAEQADTDGDGVGDNGDAFPANPAESADSDDDGVGNNGDAFPSNPDESRDTDGDGAGDNGDAFPNDPAERRDLDGDGTGDNGDTDDDNDGRSDVVEGYAPNRGDGNGDGIADARQANVMTFADTAARTLTLAVPAGVKIVNAAIVANPNPAMAPAGVAFERGFLAFELEVAPGAATAVNLWLHGTGRPDSYYKYGPDGAGSVRFHEFVFNGLVGAEIFSSRIVLHLVDGLRGDSDLEANGRIVDPGAASWTVDAAPPAPPPPATGGGGDSGGGGGGSLDLAVLLGLLLLARRRGR